MKSKQLILVFSALSICVARGQTANDEALVDCNGKSFRCIDPGSYVQCDVDPADSIRTISGDSDTLICADDTTCDDNAELPCTPNEPEPTETPTEPSDDGNDGSEVDTPDAEDGATELTSENPDPNEGESSTTNNSNGDEGSGDSTEPTDSNEGETSTSDEHESPSESATTSEEGNSSNSTEPPTTTTPETPEFTCPAVGRFPHPTDCQKYNFCWDLEHPYVTFTCRTKLVFDALLGRCTNDWSTCLNAPKCVANHQLLADPSDNRYYFICKNIGSLLLPEFVIHKKECDKHSTFDSELLICVPNEVDGGEENDSSESDEHHEKVKFECTEAGIFADLTDETKYYECIVKNVAKGKMKTHHRNCPKNHVFSLQDIQCIPIVVGEILDEQ